MKRRCWQSWVSKEGTCLGCDEVLINCNKGEIVNSYYRHHPKSTCKVGEGGESDIHKIAKYQITKLLNNKGKLCFVNSCSLCYSNYTTKLELEEDCVAKEEVRYRDGECVWDVACIKNNEVYTGIEIYYKHKTTNVEPRNNIVWYEIRAEEVDINNPTFKNHSDTTCDNCKRILEERHRIKIDFSIPAKQSIKVTIMDLAIRLGYVTKTHSFPSSAHRQIYCVNYGKDIVNIEYKLKSNNTKDCLWNEFLAMKRCMMCNCKYNSRKSRPYCIRCYISLKKSNRKRVCEITLSEVTKHIYESKLYFLDDVPLYSEGDKCSLCNNNEEVGIMWKGSKKSICTGCIQNH